MKNSVLYEHENIQLDHQWIETPLLAQGPSAHYLESDLCDMHSIHQDRSTNQPCDTDRDEEELDEIDKKELTAPFTDRMLDNPHTDISSIAVAFAPGEGKRPVCHEQLVEYLAFPTIYCGKTCFDNKARVHAVQQRDIFKYEL